MFPRSQGTEPGKGATFDDCIARLPEIAGSASMSSISCRSIRSAASTAKAKTTARSPSPATLAAPMRSARARAATGRSTPSSARSPISAVSSRRRSARHGGGARFRDPSARPTIHGCASIRNGSASGPTERSNTPKTRPRSTKTSSMSISTTRTAKDCGPNCATRSCSGSIEGVRTFRVDNPHTKPLPFWEWLIREVKARCPEAIFLSEAFTRPKMMRALAKAGFTQSYTYFTWRNTKSELIEYLTELTVIPGERIFSAELLHQHAGHPAGVPAGGRPAGVPHPPRAGGDVVAGLRHL